VADALVSLTYAEMMELGISLADIFTDRDNFDTTSRDDWASLLRSWAESYDPEVE
jgi:hypothetical protein